MGRKKKRRRERQTDEQEGREQSTGRRGRERADQEVTRDPMAAPDATVPDATPPGAMSRNPMPTNPMPGNPTDRSTSPATRPLRSRGYGPEAQEHILRATTETGTDPHELPDPVLDVLASGNGRSLEPSIQRALEERMDADFSNVEIHTGVEAAKAADAIDAKAFTCGNAIVFNEGEYDPESTDGQHLLAHELAHVRQQTGTTISMMPQADAELEIDPDPQLEREAEQAATEALEGEEPRIVTRMGTDVHIQRLSNEDRLENLRRRANSSKSKVEIYQERLIEETPINHVDLGNFTGPELAEVFETLLDANEKGLLEGLDRITTNSEWARNASIRENGIAGYDLSEQAIYFNPDEFTTDQIKELHEDGWFATGSIEGSVYHELGHHQHIENLRDSVVSTKHLMESIEEEEFSPETERIIREEISEYGTKVQPYEFIAEVFAMEKIGKSIPDELTRKFERLFDPEP